LADYYKPEARPLVYARHSNAQRWGAIIGPAFAGVVAWLFDWRAAFIVLIFPIIAMAVISLRLKEPVRGATDNEDAAELAEQESHIPLGRAARMLWSVKTLRREYMAWLFIAPALIPLAILVPDYFEKVFHVGTVGRGLILAA